MRACAKKATVLLGSLLVALLLAEGLLLLVEPTPGGMTHFVLAPNSSREFHPSPGVMPGVNGSSTYTVNSAGIRGRAFDSTQRLRLLALGGSTTECLFLDDTECWTALLEQRLDAAGPEGRVWVGNVGRSGLNARDHRHQVGPLLDQYPRIDAILVMVGLNDLLSRLAWGQDYDPAYFDSPDGIREQIKKAFARIEQPPRPGAWYERRAIFRIWRRAWIGRPDGREIPQPDPSRVMVQDAAGEAYVAARERRRNGTELDTLPDLQPALEEFGRNVDRIARAAIARGVRPIFLTQATLWRAEMPESERERLWLGVANARRDHDAASYYSPAALAEGIDRYNRRLLQYCRDHEGVDCIDVASGVPKQAAYFYDGVHLTEAGAEIVAEVIFEGLVQLRLLDR